MSDKLAEALQQIVRVLPDRYSPEYTGLNAVKEKEVPREKWARGISFIEAVQTEWDTPAEFQVIEVPGVKAGDDFPRVGRKWALNLYGDVSDPEVLPGTNIVILDLDHCDKKSSNWSERARRGFNAADKAFFALLDRLRARHGFGWYLTNSGARLFGVSQKRITIDVYEDYMTRFMVSLAKDGYQVGDAENALLGVTDPFGHHVDSVCYDLGRLVKLPRIPGAGGAHSGLKWLESTLLKPIDFAPESLLAWSFGGKAQAALLVSNAAPPAPEPLKRSEYAGLKGLWCYDLLTTPLAIGKPGARHEPALKVCGAIAGRLQTSDAARVYQMALPSLRASVSAGDDENALMRELWQIAQYVCAGQAATINQKTRIAFERSGLRKDALARIAELNGCDQATALRRIVLTNANGNAFVYDELERNYAPRIYDVKSNIALALKYHCPNLIELKNEQGQYVSDRTLALNYASPVVERVRFVYGLESTEYDADGQTLSLRAARISPKYKPAFSDKVDSMLRALTTDHYEDLKDWLHFFPNTQRALCALYLQAEQGVGKNVLTQGLAQLFDANPVPYSVAGADFRKQLLYSPLLHIDESIPLAQFGSNNSTSLFRQMIGSKSHDVNMKNKDPVELRGFPRLLITANTADALKIRENLTPEDIGAIQIRVGFINVDSARARAYMESLSLAEIDNMMTNEFPCHILWLAENHTPSVSKTDGVHRRFASWESSIFATSVKLEIGKTKKVAEAIVRWYLRAPSRDPDNGVFAHNGEIFVKQTQLTKVWEAVMSKANRMPDTEEIISALRVLAPEGCNEPNKPIRVKGVAGTIRAWRVDPLKLQAVAKMLDMDESEFGERLRIEVVAQAAPDDDEMFA